MGETIESMINALKTKVDILEDKIIYNDIDFNGNLEQIKDMSDKEEKERILYILEYLKINAEHYINKIKESDNKC